MVKFWLRHICYKTTVPLFENSPPQHKGCQLEDRTHYWSPLKLKGSQLNSHLGCTLWELTPVKDNYKQQTPLNNYISNLLLTETSIYLIFIYFYLKFIINFYFYINIFWQNVTDLSLQKELKSVEYKHLLAIYFFTTVG